MNAPEKAVIAAAKAWWRNGRPCTWSLAEHLRYPAVNRGDTPANARLARAVAKLYQKR